MKAVVTGGAGFIGSHVVEGLLKKGFEVVVIDNLSSGNPDNLKNAYVSGRIKLVVDDLKVYGSWINEFRDANVVYHLAANPEVKTSITNPRKHFEENVLATFNVLEACREYKVKNLVFASTSTVYGDAKTIPTPEDYSPLEPISIYGASKLASENLILSYSLIYGIKSLILRFANIVGPRQTHGVVVDFINKLRLNPSTLEILGDGTQKKSYLHVQDLIEGINVAERYLRESNLRYLVINVGNEDWITVKEIADLVVSEMNLSNVTYVFKPATEDGRGWVGDVKFMLLDISKLKSLGWRPKYTSKEAIRSTIRWFLSSR
ncbi:MAG: UDP-glucose 4-epimerase [Zestosphaera tikiterensis]|uniref:UDP-glucose 4-epimerase n=1 Tax=Zestosphaera tikiterensis TaxID=1973259 RepID=A0A2R7Y501_9CREN|nr:MAG: UDP-glucose 4-epimerase [Zestosphaera tikiterensis]